MARTLALLLAVALMVACSAAVSPEPSPSPTVLTNLTPPPPTPAGPTPAPTPTAAATPLHSSEAPAPITGLAQVRVSEIGIRKAPGTDQPIETLGPGSPADPSTPLEMRADQDAWVIDRREVDGKFWYQVVGGSSYVVAWVPAGSAANPTLARFELSQCPSSRSGIFRVLGDHPMRDLACFGDRPIALDVYWLSLDEQQLDIPCSATGPRWLLCYEYVNLTGGEARELAVYGTTELAQPLRGNWVTLTGHLDDARSPACPASLGYPDDMDAGELAATVLFCRTRFVADSVVSAPRY